MNTLSTYQKDLEQDFRAAYLIGGFIRENLTEEEEEELEQWILQSERHLQIFEDLTDKASVGEYMRWYYQRDTEKKLEQVKKRIHFKSAGKLFYFWKYAAVAGIAVLLLLGIYYKLSDQVPPALVENYIPSGDIAPGSESATLTLAHGRKIDLRQLKDTLISSQVRIENGTIIYNNAGDEPEYHELTIPRKGFYQLVLPDGSRVWVNSESSIRYPSRFTGPERNVTVTGETYFEVAKDPQHPFIVSVNGVAIKAVGTAFNINAYPEEGGLRATLTEGRIKITGDRGQEYLEPGQQLLVQPDLWILRTVDTAPVTAWTKQQFKFKGSTIEEVMRPVERWYDARVVYKEKVDDHFTGTIDRQVPVSQLLKLLEATGRVHFRVEGKTITVSH